MVAFKGHPQLKFISHVAEANIPGTLRLKDLLAYPSALGKSITTSSSAPAAVEVKEDGSKVGIHAAALPLTRTQSGTVAQEQVLKKFTNSTVLSGDGIY